MVKAESIYCIKHPIDKKLDDFRISKYLYDLKKSELSMSYG